MRFFAVVTIGLSVFFVGCQEKSIIPSRTFDLTPNERAVLERRALQGDNSASLSLSNYFLFIRNDPTNALYWLEKSAQDGNVVAQYNYAEMLLKSSDNIDHQKAVYWLKEASAKGDSSAQIRLASCYENGIGASKDYSESKYWYEKAALNGSPVAMERLAQLYLEGKGISQSKVNGYVWLRLASMVIHQDSNIGRDLQIRLVTLARELSNSELSTAQMVYESLLPEVTRAKKGN